MWRRHVRRHIFELEVDGSGGDAGLEIAEEGVGDDRRIGGVCSGIALYLDVDVVIVRILMLVALICGTLGFWIYVICWIAVPEAITPAQKCEMHGLPVTAENMAKFARTQNY